MRPYLPILLGWLLLPVSLHAQRSISLSASPQDASLTASTADLQARDLFGRSLLLQAVNAQTQTTVALLLERGADPNARDKQGLTALALAVAAGNERLTALLLERGADPNAAFPPCSQTALHLLASLQPREAHIPLAQLLLEKGADPCRKDVLGNTPISYAAKSKQKSLKKLFMKYLRDQRIAIHFHHNKPQ